MMQSLLDPAILFFALGVFAGLVRSNLEMPAAISKFLSIYLLMALGLKGGFALAASGFTSNVATSLGLAVLLAIVVPLVGYALLRRGLSGVQGGRGRGRPPSPPKCCGRRRNGKTGGRRPWPPPPRPWWR